MFPQLRTSSVSVGVKSRLEAFQRWVRTAAEDEDADQHTSTAPPMSSSGSAQRASIARHDIALVARQVFTELRGDAGFSWLQQYLSPSCTLAAADKGQRHSLCSGGATSLAASSGWVPLSSAFHLLRSAAPQLAGSIVQSVVTTLSYLADTTIASAASGQGSASFSPAVSPPSSFYSPNGRIVAPGGVEPAPQKQGGHVVLAHLGVVLLSWIASRSCSLVDVIAGHSDALRALLYVDPPASSDARGSDSRDDGMPYLEPITIADNPLDEVDVHQWAADRWLLEWATERLVLQQSPTYQEERYPLTGGGVQGDRGFGFPPSLQATPPPTQTSSPQRSARASLHEIGGAANSSGILPDITPIRPSARYPPGHANYRNQQPPPSGNELLRLAVEMLTPNDVSGDRGATPLSGEDDHVLFSAAEKTPYLATYAAGEVIMQSYSPPTIFGNGASPPGHFVAASQEPDPTRKPHLTREDHDLSQLLHLQRARQVISMLLPHCPAPLLDHMIEECLDEVHLDELHNNHNKNDGGIPAGSSWSDAADCAMALVHFVAHRWDVGVGAAFSGSYVSTAAVTHFDATKWLIGSGGSGSDTRSGNNSIVRNISTLSAHHIIGADGTRKSDSSPSRDHSDGPAPQSPTLVVGTLPASSMTRADAHHVRSPTHQGPCASPPDSAMAHSDGTPAATTTTARHRLSTASDDPQHPSKRYQLADGDSFVGGGTASEAVGSFLLVEQPPAAPQPPMTNQKSGTNLRRRMRAAAEQDAQINGGAENLSEHDAFARERDVVVDGDNPRCGGGGCCVVM